MYPFVRNILITCTLAILACQKNPPVDSQSRSFTWNDLSRPVSFPGPLFDTDTTYDDQSLRVVANLAHFEFDSIRTLIHDSLFVAVSEKPYEAKLKGLDQLQAWRSSLGSVQHEAFNVRGIYNQGSSTHVSYVFSRWKSTGSKVNFDRFVVFTIAWNSAGKITGIALFATDWPRDSIRPIQPTRRPEKFHFYSSTRLGSDSTAQKAMDFTTGIFRNNLRMHQHLLADSVEYHDGQGQYGYYSRAKVLDMLDHRTKSHKHHLIRYTAVVPWKMLRFDREMAAVVTYEDWINRDGTTSVYSFCRLYFFDEQGKINNFVFTRRLVHPVGRYPLVD